MSAANTAIAGELITLDELERLIRIMGMLGSAADGEVLAAAKFAQKWVVEKGTDWRTLLTPPEESLPVTGVGAPPDPDALAQAAEADRVQAYANGYQAGMRDMAQQLKAQAAFAQQARTTFTTGLGGSAAGLAGGLGGLGPGTHAGQGPPPGGPQGPPRGPSQGPQQGRGWRDVCQELLDRRSAGIPGVFRNANEENFVGDVLGRGFATLTPAQEAWLRDIAGRNGLSW